MANNGSVVITPTSLKRQKPDNVNDKSSKKPKKLSDREKEYRARQKALRTKQNNKISNAIHESSTCNLNSVVPSKNRDTIHSLDLKVSSPTKMVNENTIKVEPLDAEEAEELRNQEIEELLNAPPVILPPSIKLFEHLGPALARILNEEHSHSNGSYSDANGDESVGRMFPFLKVKLEPQYFEHSNQSMSSEDIALPTSVPSTSVSSTAVPTPSVSSTAIPSTSSRSTSSRPTPSRPTTSRSSSSLPTTSLPTSSLPTSSRPTSSRPSSSRPTSSRPTSSRPTSSCPTPSCPTSSRPPSSRPPSSRPPSSRSTSVPSTSLCPNSVSSTTALINEPSSESANLAVENEETFSFSRSSILNFLQDKVNRDVEIRERELQIRQQQLALDRERLELEKQYFALDKRERDTRLLMDVQNMKSVTTRQKTMLKIIKDLMKKTNR